MKTYLEFTLPEEQDNLKDSLNVSCYRSAIQEYDNFLRQKLKYENLTATEEKVYAVCREKLHDFFDAFEVSVWG